MHGWPLLRRAPGRILHSGLLAAMILVSVVLLAALVAAGPLFGSATRAGGLDRRLSAIPVTASSLARPVVQVTVRNGPGPEAEPRIIQLVDRIPYLGPGVTSLYADAVDLEDRSPQPYLLTGAGDRRPGLMIYRTGALDQLQVVQGRKGAPGVWIPEGEARDLKLRPGDRMEVGKSYRYQYSSCGSPVSRFTGTLPPDRRTTVTVAGTYRTGPDARLPAGSYFSDVSRDLPSDFVGCPTNALMLFADRATVDTALTAMQEAPLWTYTAALTEEGWQPAHLDRATAATADLRLAAAQPGTAANRLLNDNAHGFRIDSGLPAIHQQAVADARAAAEQGRGIAYAGGVIGLAAVVVALRALAQRRRRETELLLGLGTPTPVVVLAATVELVLPAVVGAALGWGVAALAFGSVGPHPDLDPAAVRTAAGVAALVAVVTLLAAALVTLGQARQVSRALSGRADSRLGNQWLPLLTGATVLAVAGTLARDRGESYHDPMAALLPILILACGCALLTRAFTWIGGLRPRSGERGGRDADRLVRRGLRRTGVAVADLVVVLSIGIGVLAYGLLASSLVHRSVTDKAAVLAGAPTSAHITYSWLLGGGEGAAPKLPGGTAVVWRARGFMRPDSRPYDILAIDPDSFRSAATWGTGGELAAARTALHRFDAPRIVPRRPGPDPGASADVRRDDSSVPPLSALVVGDTDRQAGSTARLEISSITQPAVIRERVSAFPGAVRPTVVLDARELFPRLDALDDPSHTGPNPYNFEGAFDTWVWTNRSLPALRRDMDARGIPTAETYTLAQARATPALTSAGWAAGYQVVLGSAAAALAGLALVVAVDRRVARAAAVDLVLSRFGFRRRRLLRVRAVELAGTALAALGVLGLPLAGLVLLLPRIVEPDPALPPAMPVGVSLVPLLLSVAVAAVVTLVAVLAAARRSAALNPGEVLRDDA
jgi:hypothetical protein